jgi:hypothetical protein
MEASIRFIEGADARCPFRGAQYFFPDMGLLTKLRSGPSRISVRGNVRDVKTPESLVARRICALEPYIPDVNLAIPDDVRAGQSSTPFLRPSDGYLLAPDVEDPPRRVVNRITVSHVLDVIHRADAPIQRTVSRLKALSDRFDLAMPSADAAAVERILESESERRLLSWNLDGQSPWIDQISPGHILWARQRLDVPASEVLSRLRDLAEAFGIDGPAVSAEEVKEHQWTETDWHLLSQELLGTPPWIDRVDAGHILIAIRELDQPPSEIGTRLQELADVFDLEMVEVDVEAVQERDWTEADERLLDRKLSSYGRPQWIKRVDPGHVLAAIHKIDAHPQKVVTRLQDLGGVFGLEMDEVDVEALDAFTFTEEDWQLLSQRVDGDPPYVTDVTEDRLVVIAWHTNTPYPEVVETLRRLEPVGVQLPASVQRG